MRERSHTSATISAGTKERLDRFMESHSLKKSYVVEQALLYFMEARRNLPDEAILPARLVLDDKAFEQVVRSLESPPAPTDALCATSSVEIRRLWSETTARRSRAAKVGRFGSAHLGHVLGWVGRSSSPMPSAA